MFSCEFFYIQNTSERLLLILLRRLLYIFHCQKFSPQKKSLCAKISTSGKPAYCGSPFSERESRDCKIRSLSMRSISCSTCIYFICATEKKFYQLELFFSPWRMMTLVLTKHKGSLLKYMQNYCLDFDKNFRICYGIR